MNQPTDQGPVLIPSYCGQCTRCLTACPTNAFTESGQLNSNQCISYLTLEKRVESNNSEKTKNDLKWDKEARVASEKRLNAPLKGFVAGCDLCQEVCPFNFKRTKAERNLVEEDPDEILTDIHALIDETEEDYRKRVRKTALSRVKPDMWRRNLMTVLDQASPEKKELPKN